jgi:hypothetical protein
VLQTDAQVALTLLRWDLFMAGYGMNKDEPSIQSINSDNGPDQVTLRGVGLGFEAEYTDWSPILATVAGTEIMVYEFNDTMPDFKTGDVLIVVDQEKKLVDSNIIVQDVEHTTYTNAGFTMNAVHLTVDRNVAAAQGSIVFRPDIATYTNGVDYDLVNKHLMRGDQVFLDNVEDIQLAYGVDLNDNGSFDANEWFNDLADVPGYMPQLLYDRKTVIRSTFVLLSDRGLTDYTYPASACTLEDHIYALTDRERKYKREFVSTISWPRNLQN